MITKSITTADQIQEAPRVASSTQRLSSVDLARGVIMFLMAFSHNREYVGVENHLGYHWDTSAVWLNHSWLNIFHQLFVVVFVAPGFFMLMGVSMIFLFHSRLNQGWDAKKITHYFLYRGLILIALQLTYLQCYEWMAENEIYYYQGVLLSLGLSMIAGGYLLYSLHYLKHKFNQSVMYIVPAIFFILLTVGMQLLINHYQQAQIVPSLGIAALFTSGNYQSLVPIDFDFPPVPWFSTVLIGFIVGEYLYRRREQAFSMLGKLSLLLFFCWLTLRSVNLMNWFSFGSYKTLGVHDALTWESFIYLSKQPPSLTYNLLAVSFMFALLYGFFQLNKYRPSWMWLFKPFLIFGQSALFFFLVHWWVYYSISHYWHDLSSGWSISLAWLCGLVIMYPLCLWYSQFKFSKPSDSIWRMF